MGQKIEEEKRVGKRDSKSRCKKRRVVVGMRDRKRKRQHHT